MFERVVLLEIGKLVIMRPSRLLWTVLTGVLREFHQIDAQMDEGNEDAFRERDENLEEMRRGVRR